ncbi:MAG: hypothetical protein ACRDY1_04680, partial [Acidimicrobiales bacterium]
METVNGATAVDTFFEPDPTLTATPSLVPLFVGKDPNSGGSVVDVSALVSPDTSAQAVSGLTATMNANTSASPGQVQATVGTTVTTLVDFHGVDEVMGSTSIPTDFQPGTATDVTFVGQSGPGNILNLAAAPSGTSLNASSGTVTGLSGGGSDTFSGIQSFVGSSAG